MKKRFFVIIALCLVLICGGVFVWKTRHPDPFYSGAHFGIQRYFSEVDHDGDGVDDQSDIYRGVLTYLATNPKYKSKYYQGGYPDDEYGVCTDVVAFALRDAGYDLKKLVSADIAAAPDAYDITAPDENIDFRRVRNLNVYFRRHAISLSTDLNHIAEWQPGDIVVFSKHIGMISEKRDENGVPYLLHNANPYQRSYEEPLASIGMTIVAHYRIS